MSIDEADAIAPEIELKKLLAAQAPKHVNIHRVIVMSPKYVKDLSVILAATDKEVLQRYMIWKLVQSFASYIDADAVKPYKRFNNVLAGKVCSHLFTKLCSPTNPIRTLTPLLSDGERVWATSIEVWVGFSVAFLLKRPSPPRQKSSATQSLQTLRPSSQRS